MGRTDGDEVSPWGVGDSIDAIEAETRDRLGCQRPTIGGKEHAPKDADDESEWQMLQAAHGLTSNRAPKRKRVVVL